jgi:hypothetical protein
LIRFDLIWWFIFLSPEHDNKNFINDNNNHLTNHRLKNERRLFLSELRALDRETQTEHVLLRKKILSKEVPAMEQEMVQLERSLRKMLASPTDQLNPSGKYYVLAEKLVKV